MLHRKCAETTQFDPIAPRQSRDNLIENSIHNVLDIPLVQVRVVLGDALNQFGLIIETGTRKVRSRISVKIPCTVKTLNENGGCENA